MKNLRITIPASQDLDEISDYFLAQSIDIEILRVISGYRNLQDVLPD